MTDNIVPVRFQVAEQFRNEFKAACAKSGKSQADVIRELMSRFIDGEIKVNPTGLSTNSTGRAVTNQ